MKLRRKEGRDQVRNLLHFFQPEIVSLKEGYVMAVETRRNHSRDIVSRLLEKLFGLQSSIKNPFKLA